MGTKKLVKISDLIPAPEVIQISDTQELEVRAIQFDDIVNLFLTHKDAFLAMYSEATSAKPSFEQFMLLSPDLVASIIACGANASGQEEDIRQLPGTVQLVALAAIWKLSVPDPKKLRESLSLVMEQLQKLSPVQAPVTGQENDSAAPMSEQPLSTT